MPGLYLHVPFCRSRCHFCAFYLRIHREDWARRFLDLLDREIALHAEANTLRGREVETVYFGGGTPTTLAAGQLAAILQRLRARFRLSPTVEITVEAHPETVTAEGLHELAQAGFNRISFGVQSMEDRELSQAGRAATHSTVARVVDLARQAGFANLNLDVMYGLPGQTPESWRDTLDETLALAPTHLSCYALTIEEGTRFAVDRRRGDLHEPDPAAQNAMEDDAAVRLAAAGFARYEISNYCRPGFACRHNLLYWSGGDYLGLGPSAQSYVDGVRFGNAEDQAAYEAAVAAGRLPTGDRETLTPAQRLRDRLVFGLRLTEGVTLEPVLAGLEGDRRRALERLLGAGWLEQRGGRLRLTEWGRRFADSVAAELL